MCSDYQLSSFYGLRAQVTIMWIHRPADESASHHENRTKISFDAVGSANTTLMLHYELLHFSGKQWINLQAGRRALSYQYLQQQAKELGEKLRVRNNDEQKLLAPLKLLPGNLLRYAR